MNGSKNKATGAPGGGGRGGGARSQSHSQVKQEGSRIRYKLLEDFEDIQKIGSGGFGLVVKAKKLGEKKVTAVKLIPFDNRQTVQKTIDEANRLSTIPPHPAVVRCIAFWEDSFSPAEFRMFAELVRPSKNEVFNTFPTYSKSADFLCIQMELCGNGDLRAWLKRRGSALSVAHVDFPLALKIFFQVAKGIEHIHKSGLIHRDLKPGNILLHGTQAKVSDLGYSAAHTSDDYCHTKNAGACLYQSPEQAYGEYGKSVDYYALGFILYELFHPASQKNVGEAISRVKYMGGALPTEVESTFPKVAGLIKRLISLDPKDRPNAREIEQEILQWPEFSDSGHDSLGKALNCDKLSCQRCANILTDVRFKCSICPDYFLCQECEGIAGTHPMDHDLLKIKTPVPQEGTELGSTIPTKNCDIGCQHYKRKCKIQCADVNCKRFYACHLCHDEDIKGHKLNRKKVSTIECTECSTIQLKGSRCEECDVPFAKYCCEECCMYDDDEGAEKLTFHCDKCGFCRKKAHASFFYAHCDNCSMCYPHLTIDDEDEIVLFPDHECQRGAGQLPCSVCQKTMHDSRENAILVECQHYVHLSCKAKFPVGQTKCPTCGHW